MIIEVFGQFAIVCFQYHGSCHHAALFLFCSFDLERCLFRRRGLSLPMHVFPFLPSSCFLCQHFNSLLPWGPCGLRHTFRPSFFKMTMISSLVHPGLFKMTVKSETGPSTPFLDFRQVHRFGTCWHSALWTVNWMQIPRTRRALKVCSVDFIVTLPVCCTGWLYKCCEWGFPALCHSLEILSLLS